LCGRESTDDEIPRKVKEATKNRLARQPLDLPSCGSTFKNPDGGKAGALIEKAGLKGFRIGGAQVSPKHANFIVNTGGASAQDVITIIRHVQSEVKSQFGFTLETEVKFLGRW
jgi:UDP-N-acetylmuramate dehydrogenase